MEEWKDIEGYEGMYQVSTYGNVRGLDRLDNRGRIVHGRILKRNHDGQGYPQVHLCKNGKIQYRHIHRIVAEAFIPNPENKETVNHKDENKENDHVDNLEWMTMKENANYGTRKERCYGNRDRKKVLEICKMMGRKNMRPVLQYAIDGTFLHRWDSVTAAANSLGVSIGCMRSGLKNNPTRYKGYSWKYENQLTPKGKE